MSRVKSVFSSQWSMMIFTISGAMSRERIDSIFTNSSGVGWYGRLVVRSCVGLEALPTDALRSESRRAGTLSTTGFGAAFSPDAAIALRAEDSASLLTTGFGAV